MHSQLLYIGSSAKALENYGGRTKRVDRLIVKNQHAQGVPLRPTATKRGTGVPTSKNKFSMHFTIWPVKANWQFRPAGKG